MNAAAFHAIDATGKSGGRPFPPDSGRIVINGSHWTNHGKPWRWRGATMFLLLERKMDGEDITPQRQWMIGKGVNVARVFTAGVPWAGHRWLYNRPDWQDHLAELASWLSDDGIRIESTVCTDNAADPKWPGILQDAYDALGRSNREMSFVEGTNEPWVQGDALSWVRNIDRRGILSSHGIQPPFGETFQVRMLDYGTAHLPRDLDHFPRNSKDLLELQISNRKPWVTDEPLGIAEVDKQGAGARTTDKMAVAGHFAIASLFGGGSTIHSECGVHGLAPSANEPITEALAQTISDIWGFIPPEAPTGSYSRAGLPDFPLKFDVNGNDSTLSSQHAYASILGDLSYAVVPKPRAGYVAEGVNGWRVDAELLPGIVRLVR